MSTATSQVDIPRARLRPAASQFAAAAEVLAVFAGILLYIWRWQYSRPYFWIPLLVLVLASHFFHRDKLRNLGLGLGGLRSGAAMILPFTAAILLTALVYGVAKRIIIPARPNLQDIHYFGNYLLWCIFQQYLVQSFFNNRLMEVFGNRHASSVLVALMFGAAHIPNAPLMAVTTAGGFILAEVFARRRNIWPLALAQAVSGTLVAALVPAPLLHNMRVGPGYYFYLQP